MTQENQCPHCGKWFMSEKQKSAHVTKQHSNPDDVVQRCKDAEAIAFPHLKKRGDAACPENQSSSINTDAILPGSEAAPTVQPSSAANGIYTEQELKQRVGLMSNRKLIYSNQYGMLFILSESNEILLTITPLLKS